MPNDSDIEHDVDNSSLLNDPPSYFFIKKVIITHAFEFRAI